MAHTARDRLSELMDEYGDDGRLLIFHDDDDPLGRFAEGAELAPYSGIERPYTRLRREVARANARSRGEIL